MVFLYSDDQEKLRFFPQGFTSQAVQFVMKRCRLCAVGNTISTFGKRDEFLVLLGSCYLLC